MDRFKIIKNRNFDELPKTSGVYSFYTQNTPIYIGKAINIQNRVKNHFSQPSYRDNLFISKIEKIGFFETNSEIEALILEASLIKKNQPKFNVIWKDDKNYFYVAFVENSTGAPYVFITHQPSSHSVIPLKNGIQIRRGLDPRIRGDDIFVGPFVEGVALKKTLRFLRKAFPYYSVKNHPKNKCTYCHLGLCPGANPDLAEYKKSIKKLILILQGKRVAVLNYLKKEMTQFSKNSQFEKAREIRDRIFALKQIMSHTHVLQNNTQNLVRSDLTKSLSALLGLESISRIECYDVSNIQGKQATSSMVVFVDGVADKSEYKKFKIRMKNEPNDIAMLKETLERRFLHPEWTPPEVILIDGGIAQLNVAIRAKNKNLETQNIKIISIAKRNKELFIEGREKPVLLKTLPREIFNLVLQLDDEAHRFAITYHKKLRKENLLQ